jgi:hypothetical protein
MTMPFPSGPPGMQHTGVYLSQQMPMPQQIPMPVGLPEGSQGPGPLLPFTPPRTSAPAAPESDTPGASPGGSRNTSSDNEMILTDGELQWFNSKCPTCEATEKTEEEFIGELVETLKDRAAITELNKFINKFDPKAAIPRLLKERAKIVFKLIKKCSK